MREALLGVAVGKKGIGKTYITLEIIKSYVQGLKGIKPRRALLLDVNDEFTQIKAISLKDVQLFSMHPKIESRRIRPYNTDGSKMSLTQIAETLKFVLDKYKSGLLLIEDVNRYISDNMPSDVIGALCTNRHSDTDIILHYQSIGRISPKVWQNLNYVRYHKNTDSVERHKKKFEDKYEVFRIIEIMVNKQYISGNNRFFVTYDADTEKIRGAYTKQMFSDAVDEYIALSYNQKVKPLLNMIVGGVKIHTPESATNEIKKELTNQYHAG